MWSDESEPKNKSTGRQGQKGPYTCQFDMLGTEYEIEACEYCGTGNYTYQPFGCYKPQPPKKSEEQVKYKFFIGVVIELPTERGPRKTVKYTVLTDQLPNNEMICGVIFLGPWN